MADASEGKKVVELSSAPGALTTYRRAVLQRAHGKDRVPDKVLKLTGVTPELDHVKAYLDVCGGRLTDTLPLLYPHMLGFPLQMSLLTDGDSPFAAMGLVHVLNSATQLKPLPLSAALDVEAEMAAPQLHRRGRTIDLLVRVSIDGELVWHSSSTYLKRESTKGRSEEVAGEGKAEKAVPEALLTKPGPLWRLPSDLGRQYGEVSGDRNPIHMYGLSAKLFGFNSAIAHGMWTAARSLAALEGRVPDAVRNDVEFKQPIPLPGTVEFADDGGIAGAKEIDYVVRARKPRKDGSAKLHLVGSVTAL
ncbi:MaoC family dehydratase [Spongisporangium articulatum]|uniref:MaoC family dehydratase n=1 Tax=Spongisporangium articulatum TaxID=3362603 RepID=A0ABW8AKI3_9ACTN